jgi:hypothetical protein
LLSEAVAVAAAAGARLSAANVTVAAPLNHAQLAAASLA